MRNRDVALVVLAAIALGFVLFGLPLLPLYLVRFTDWRLFLWLEYAAEAAVLLAIAGTPRGPARTRF